MAGIEELVLNEILTDFGQRAAADVGLMEPASMAPAPSVGSSGPGGMNNRQYAEALVAANPRSPVNPETGLPWGQFATQAENERVKAMQTKDAAQAKILQGLQGLDPQIQGAILKRMGINPGPIQSKLQQSMALEKFKQDLERPQQELLNTFKMMTEGRQATQGREELELKRRGVESGVASRERSGTIQFLRTLALMAQGKPQLEAALAPLIFQMAQSMGINLAPSTPSTNAPAGRPGIKITRED